MHFKILTDFLCEKNKNSWETQIKAVNVLQARVLATIGVTRGLGDHDLKVHDSNIYIKPFLSCCPEVRASAANSLLTHIQSLQSKLKGPVCGIQGDLSAEYDRNFLNYYLRMSFLYLQSERDLFHAM